MLETFLAVLGALLIVETIKLALAIARHRKAAQVLERFYEAEQRRTIDHEAVERNTRKAMRPNPTKRNPLDEEWTHLDR